MRTLKLPSDIWNYQGIIFERKVEYVHETGTRHGGSAMFFAETLATHERICFLIGDSASREMVDTALGLLPDAAREAKFGTSFAARGYYVRA